jgi:DNA invertase Pin-like site-specific DNA recombinase
MDPPAQPPRAALYARVSTDDKGQTPENQLEPLRRHCREQGWQWIEYVDFESGRKADREQFRRMLEDAEQGKFNIVVAWRLDRLTREPMKRVLGYLERLEKAGVKFKSLTEPFLDTTQPFADVLFALFSWVADLEVKTIQARIKAGLDRARAGGKILGRRPKHGDRVGEVRARILRLRGEGRSLREISDAVGLSRSRVSQIIKAAQPPVKPLPMPQPHPTMPGFYSV